MRNKPFIIGLATIITLLCIYYISFTFVSRHVESNAAEYALDDEGNINFSKKQAYLDSVFAEPVYNLLGVKYTYKEVKNNELKLGLDLQGGMHVVMEVSPIEILRAMSNNSPDPAFNNAIAYADKSQKNSNKSFIDLFYEGFRNEDPDGKLSRIFSNTANMGRISFESTNNEVLKVLSAEVESAIDRTFIILRTRIDKFGVTQPNIQRLQGTGRIQIELPGADNPERVRKLLSGVAKLEFWEVWDNADLFPIYQRANDVLAEIEEAERSVGMNEGGDANMPDPFASNEAKISPVADPFADDLVMQSEDAEDTSNILKNPTDTGLLSTADTSGLENDSLNSKVSVLFRLIRSQYDLFYNVADTAKINQALANPKLKGVIPNNMKFLWDVKAIKADNGRQDLIQLYAIRKSRDGKAPLTGEVINDARHDIDQNGRGFEIRMVMNSKGAQKWKRLTGENINKRIAIVLDNYVYSAPTVQGEIPNGISSITGTFTLEEAKDLANVLKAGKLPAPARIVEEAIVGPTLGTEAISQGIYAIGFGLLLVVLFMLLYYSTSGAVADFVLLINIFFILGIMAQLGAAMTLPGIAGIVLTIGMSVDANVLIFERIREELNAGRPMLNAVKNGFDKAYSSIIDSNVTTFLTGAILFIFGSGPVQGFATTLMVGIGCSFFTAVFIARVIVELLLKRRAEKGISFESVISRNLFKGTNFKVIEGRKIAYIFSSILIVSGLVLLFLQGGLNLGVDFKGGRTYVVRFDTPVVASDIRNSLADDFMNQGTEVKTYGANNQVKVTTSYLIDDESEEADEKVLGSLNTGLETYSEMNPKVLSSSKVGATIAEDIKNTSRDAVFFSLIVIFLYILVRFRRWQYGLGAVIALAHDALMVLSWVAIMRAVGVVFEIDQVFIAAMLTTIGYSINDTVIIFDRLRENIAENSRRDMKVVLNEAINLTFSRTIITSLTTFVVVLIMFLFAGEVLRGFSFALLIGIIFGTYSSIFIASAVVYDLRKIKHEEK